MFTYQDTGDHTSSSLGAGGGARLDLEKAELGSLSRPRFCTRRRWGTSFSREQAGRGLEMVEMGSPGQEEEDTPLGRHLTLISLVVGLGEVTVFH